MALERTETLYIYATRREGQRQDLSAFRWQNLDQSDDTDEDPAVGDEG